MSPRETLQNQIVTYLESQPKFNAPYGVLAGLEKLPKGGKVRTITFGQARWLDCTLRIWSPNKITVEAQGSAAYKLQPQYAGVEQLITDLENF
jgi:hypothetical protein